MRKITDIAERAAALTADQFCARYGEPVFIIEAVLGGEIQKRTPAMNSPRPGGRRLLRRRSGRSMPSGGGTSTMAYIPKVDFADPLELQREAPPGMGRYVEMNKRQGLNLGGAIVVGRNHQCDVLINDYTVSSRHVSIQYASKDSFALVDLDSTNGTWVGARKIEPRAKTILRDLHRVRMGRIRCRFLMPASFHRYLTDEAFKRSLSVTEVLPTFVASGHRFGTSSG